MSIFEYRNSTKKINNLFFCLLFFIFTTFNLLAFSSESVLLEDGQVDEWAENLLLTSCNAHWNSGNILIARGKGITPQKEIAPLIKEKGIILVSAGSGSHFEDIERISHFKYKTIGANLKNFKEISLVDVLELIGHPVSKDVLLFLENSTLEDIKQNFWRHKKDIESIILSLIDYIDILGTVQVLREDDVSRPINTPDGTVVVVGGCVTDKKKCFLC